MKRAVLVRSECERCKGLGLVKHPKNGKAPCPKCGGRGYVDEWVELGEFAKLLEEIEDERTHHRG